VVAEVPSPFANATVNLAMGTLAGGPAGGISMLRRAHELSPVRFFLLFAFYNS
jgi:hypothetical protein